MGIDRSFSSSAHANTGIPLKVPSDERIAKTKDYFLRGIDFIDEANVNKEPNEPFVSQYLNREFKNVVLSMGGNL